MGGILPGALFRREHSHRCSTWEHRKLVSLNRAQHPALCWGSQQGHRFPCLRKSSRKRWHFALSYQGWKKGVALHHMHQLLLQCWEKRICPRRCAMLASSFYTSTRVTSDYNNYRGISLLCITRKAFAHLLLFRLWPCICWDTVPIQSWKINNWWFSSWGSYRRNAESRDGRIKSHSSTWPRHLPWSAGKASPVC